MKQNFLIIDRGGRGRAFAKKLSESKNTGTIFVAGASTGLDPFAVPVKWVKDSGFEALASWASKNECITIPLSDDPIAEGIGDLFIDRGLGIWCPSRASAQIEGSKKYMKDVALRRKIPTAKHRVFDSMNDALSHIQTLTWPQVIKPDGLAGGKGTRIVGSLEAAETAVRENMEKKIHGSAGERIIIEDYLGKKELSLHAVCSYDHHILFPPARDHKRAHDGDLDDDAMTGGMGAISPVPGIDSSYIKMCDRLIVSPILEALREDDREFEGVLYPGLMLTKEGPKLLECNARPGDPETQVYMSRLKSDLHDLVMAAYRNDLEQYQLEWDPEYAVCIVLAARGYPGDPEKGKVIEGIEEAEKTGVTVLHAGTAINADGKLVTAGGRVLNVVAKGPTLEGALKLAYNAVKKINFEGMHYRKDIGKSSLV